MIREKWWALGPALLSLGLAACGGSGSGLPPAAGGTAADAVDSSESAGESVGLEMPDAASVLVGRSLTITPEVTGRSTEALTYSLSNGPPWLSVSPTTGELSGTPTPADVGRYERVRITVSDGRSRSSYFITITVTETADARATVSWEAPAERTDGSPLTDLAGFRIYFGEKPHNLRYVIEVADPGARSWVVTDLTPGTWYFAATAYDESGSESAHSNAVSKVIA